MAQGRREGGGAASQPGAEGETRRVCPTSTGLFAFHVLLALLLACQPRLPPCSHVEVSIISHGALPYVPCLP